MGRPTDYSSETLQSGRAYLADFEKHGDAVPSAAGLADVLGCARSTLYRWAQDEDKAEFSDILEAIQARQESLLINKGLKGEFNCAIVKLMLGTHGYHEKRDSTLSGPEGGPVQTAGTLKIEFVEAERTPTEGCVDIRLADAGQRAI